LVVTVDLWILESDAKASESDDLLKMSAKGEFKGSHEFEILTNEVILYW
jgi:hypothetical protein